MSGKRRGGPRRLRIVAGEWRGRRLRLAADARLRPTLERVRETLFNWLDADIRGAHCLDLFAGSGALGLEALSRGAARCWFVDRSPAAIERLRDCLAALAPERGVCQLGDAAGFLRRAPPARIDIAFLDPPFGAAPLAQCVRRLEEGGWLAAGARIYLESARRAAPPAVPGNWRPHREKTAGEVRFQLFVRASQFV